MDSNSAKVSFELFPPKNSAGLNTLKATIVALNAAKPSYFSVTYGAGGSTQNPTRNTINLLRSKFNITTVPHLTCIGSDKQLIKAMLNDYQKLGVRQLVVLRGDLPSGYASFDGDFEHAIDLVQFIRAEYDDEFELAVAAYPETHPQAKNAQRDLQYFIDKVNAGADKAITQYFYNIEAFLYFREQCAKKGVNTTLVPGIMPITNLTQLQRFSMMCGAELPQWIRKNLAGFTDDKVALQAFGVDVVSHLCEKLLTEGVEELHFYTLNKAEPTLRILENTSLMRDVA